MKDVYIKIDGRELVVKKETSILEASRQLGIQIPTLCFSKKAEGNAGCMVCMVWDIRTQKYLPACETECRSGMGIVTDSPEIAVFRRQTIELLLSEHRGACEALCDVVCPQKIPLSAFVQSINDLLAILDIDFDPAICSQCKGKCERVCRRARFDSAVPIRSLLNEKAGKVSEQPVQRQKAPKSYKHRFGKPTPTDLAAMRAHYSQPSGDSTVEKEAARCLKCGCSARDNCTLRELATRFRARQDAFKNRQPEPFQIVAAGKIAFEPTKCVRCGRCVSLGAVLKPGQGPVMANRGKNTIIAPPFGMDFGDIFTGFEQEFVDECPTGALRFF
ncbi:MAG: hypothetical protein GY866_29705 [Proteobacteria bacterium]|nr:hypothetical protein [Pseudomonadota bacterium]